MWCIPEVLAWLYRAPWLASTAIVLQRESSLLSRSSCVCYTRMQEREISIRAFFPPPTRYRCALQRHILDHMSGSHASSCLLAYVSREVILYGTIGSRIKFIVNDTKKIVLFLNDLPEGIRRKHNISVRRANRRKSIHEFHSTEGTTVEDFFKRFWLGLEIK